MEMTYNVSDLKRLIAESSNEFKAVLGPNVEKENKSNNGKAYSDAKKRAKDYDGGLAKEEKKVLRTESGNSELGVVNVAVLLEVFLKLQSIGAFKGFSFAVSES